MNDLEAYVYLSGLKRGCDEHDEYRGMLDSVLNEIEERNDWGIDRSETERLKTLYQ